MAYEPQMLRFVMIKVSIDQLLGMLENKVPMDKTFRSAKEIVTTEENTDLNSNVDLLLTANNSNSFPADHLPKAGAYYSLSFDWVKDYITQLGNEKTNSDIELSLTYTQSFNQNVNDKINIPYKGTKIKQTYESLVCTHIDNGNKISASYIDEVHEQQSYTINLFTSFDNRAA